MQWFPRPDPRPGNPMRSSGNPSDRPSHRSTHQLTHALTQHSRTAHTLPHKPWNTTDPGLSHSTGRTSSNTLPTAPSRTFQSIRQCKGSELSTTLPRTLHTPQRCTTPHHYPTPPCGRQSHPIMHSQLTRAPILCRTGRLRPRTQKQWPGEKVSRRTKP